ncbi:Uncharacterised protein [Acholeplasma oculi]|uniref:Glutaredoxin-like protein NrdH n=1 Tax=Acholeplasma oculi TaxID=35623 RepID=A0A061AFA6_9MOLU|nr:hypothetical protein [Acholeplasma oculi]CDR30186.1 glutaredoxin-like protein NrdH [Acholeplasma oculi]SKC44115.1 glutaredoxin-like protein NrdH [Acholeplasma oculi]SUT88539.1 Uncharacterised protein [Acholeplasma oculi]
MSVKLLTKNDCPQCAQLKMFLKFGLSNKYESDIEIVNKEDNKDLFEKLTAEYGILTLPAFIGADEVLTRTQPTPVVAFLEKHVGKK